MICSSRTGPLRLAPCGGLFRATCPSILSRAALGRYCAVSHESYSCARLAAVAGTLAISGIKRTHLRDAEREAGCLLLQSGCHKSSGSVGSAAFLLSSIFLCQ